MTKHISYNGGCVSCREAMVSHNEEFENFNLHTYVHFCIRDNINGTGYKSKTEYKLYSCTYEKY